MPGLNVNGYNGNPHITNKILNVSLDFGERQCTLKRRGHPSLKGIESSYFHVSGCNWLQRAHKHDAPAAGRGIQMQQMHKKGRRGPRKPVTPFVTLIVPLQWASIRILSSNKNKKRKRTSANRFAARVCNFNRQPLPLFCWDTTLSLRDCRNCFHLLYLLPFLLSSSSSIVFLLLSLIITDLPIS